MRTNLVNKAISQLTLQFLKKLGSYCCRIQTADSEFTLYLSHEFDVDEHAYDDSVICHHQVHPLERESRKRDVRLQQVSCASR